MNHRHFIILLISMMTITTGNSQCPEDPEVGRINTQEKYDFFFENYPNCGEYNIIKYDNKFIGDPRYTTYAWTLTGCLIGILILLKVIFRRWQ